MSINLLLFLAGYALREHPDFAAVAQSRAEYRRYVDALADHVGKPGGTMVRQA